MSITVRTVATSEGSGVDRTLVDIVHDEGTRFLTENGELTVLGERPNFDQVAVYSPGHWIFARTDVAEKPSW